MGTTAAFASADERMQRTERQLIDAALAVNEAPTLELALTALAETARELIGAARLAIAEWDSDCTLGRPRGEAGVAAVAGRPPIPSTDEGRRLIAAGEAFEFDLERHFELPLELRTALAAMRTRLCVTLPLDRRLTFFAYWAEELDQDDLDRAVSKLRLLGRLSNVALRAEQENEKRFIAEQFLQRLFDELPTAVAVVEPDTREIRSANRAFLDLVGLELDDVVGSRPPYPWWADHANDVPGHEEASRWEWVYRRADGSPVPVEIRRSFVHGTSGDVAAVVVIANDLSERREFERQLIQSGKLASIGELAAGVAHEINNPLFAILGFVEFLLLDAEPGTKSHERLTLIQGTALEIKEIVRALLDFARERSDERAVISLTDVASQTVELMRRTSAAKQVEIVERYADERVPVDASANQLKQIFVSLISNATHALKRSGGTVTVEVGCDGAGAWAEVRDTGPGIPADVLERVFEPFFTTRREFGGTGLGLSVSLGIVQAHGGSLTVESTAGEGAAFRLRLPLADENAPARPNTNSHPQEVRS